MSDKNKLQNTVMERITSGEVGLRSRRWFTCLECFVYTAWFISVLVGAVALAVLFYITLHGWYSFYELTGMSRLGLVLAYLPLVWLGVLLGTVVLAYKNFRRTRRGYRYPVWLVLVACIGMSFVLGALFYVLGVGQHIDTHLGERMPQYESYTQSELRFWHHPDDHRWHGELASTPAGWVLTDLSQAEWMVNVSQLPLSAQRLPQDGARVHILGTSTRAGVITACAMTHWPEGRVRTVKTLAQERRSLLTQLHNHVFTTGPCTSVGALSR